MIKILLFISFVFYGIIGLCQDHLKFYYIGKLSFAQKDSAKVPRAITFAGGMAEVVFLKNRKAFDSVMVEPDELFRSKDTVCIAMDIPLSLYKRSDSMIVRPLYHLIVAKGRSPRDQVTVDVAGKEDTVHNIKLLIKSDPPGATAYLVPKLIWERRDLERHLNVDNIKSYIVPQGPTNVVTIAQEYVYVVVYQIKDKFKTTESRPSHLNPVDSVSIKF